MLSAWPLAIVYRAVSYDLLDHPATRRWSRLRRPRRTAKRLGLGGEDERIDWGPGESG